MNFRFKLVRSDGTPADPPTIRVAVPNMRPSDTMPLGAGRTLRVVGTQASAADELPVLIVEDMAETASSAEF